MLDVHCHILPEIDDGAQDLETSLKMARIAVENGTKAIAATPHAIEGKWLPTWQEIEEKCGQLRKVLEKEGIELPIYPGAEVAFSLDILDRIDGPGAYCINGGRYMLAELPALEIPGYAEDFLFRLQAKGITPILAHPERHPEIAKNPEILVDWINKGVLIQVNGPSVLGRMGERAQKTAELLLVNNMVHLIGSDAHSANHRNTNLAKVAEEIIRVVGKQRAETLLINNPTQIIKGDDIQVFEISRLKRPQKSLLQKFLGALWK